MGGRRGRRDSQARHPRGLDLQASLLCTNACVSSEESSSLRQRPAARPCCPAALLPWQGSVAVSCPLCLNAAWQRAALATRRLPFRWVRTAAPPSMGGLLGATPACPRSLAQPGQARQALPTLLGL